MYVHNLCERSKSKIQKGFERFGKKEKKKEKLKIESKGKLRLERIVDIKEKENG